MNPHLTKGDGISLPQINLIPYLCDPEVISKVTSILLENVQCLNRISQQAAQHYALS